LPKCFKPLKKLPKFFKERNVPWKVVDEFNIGQCKDGFYKGRLIIPIATKDSHSYIAYSTFPKAVLKRYKRLSRENPNSRKYEKNKKKILNPKSSLSNLLLFNYSNIPEGCRRLFVVEGFFDAVRLWLLGEKVVAIFGTNLSDHQRNLLLEKQPQEIIFMFDGDVWVDEDKLKIVRKAMRKTARHFGGAVSYIRLKKGKDPDDVRDRATLKRLIKGRRRFGGGHFSQVHGAVSAIKLF
jgi:hypothetical protein